MQMADLVGRVDILNEATEDLMAEVDDLRAAVAGIRGQADGLVGGVASVQGAVANALNAIAELISRVQAGSAVSVADIITEVQGVAQQLTAAQTGLDAIGTSLAAMPAVPPA